LCKRRPEGEHRPRPLGESFSIQNYETEENRAKPDNAKDIGYLIGKEPAILPDYRTALILLSPFFPLHPSLFTVSLGHRDLAATTGVANATARLRAVIEARIFMPISYADATTANRVEVKKWRRVHQRHEKRAPTAGSQGSPHLAGARRETHYAIPMTPLPNPNGGDIGVAVRGSKAARCKGGRVEPAASGQGCGW
jgi:hypothetical protein